MIHQLKQSFHMKTNEEPPDPRSCDWPNIVNIAPGAPLTLDHSVEECLLESIHPGAQGEESLPQGGYSWGLKHLYCNMRQPLSQDPRDQ